MIGLIPANGLKGELDACAVKLTLDPSNGLGVGEIISNSGEIDEVDAVVGFIFVDVGVTVENGLYFGVWSQDVE